jgi:hypothetical protein
MLKLHHLSLLVILLLATANGAFGGRAPEPHRQVQGSAGAGEVLPNVSLDSNTAEFPTSVDENRSSMSAFSVNSATDQMHSATKTQTASSEKKGGRRWLVALLGILGFLTAVGWVGYRHSLRMQQVGEAAVHRRSAEHPLRKVRNSLRSLRAWKTNSFPYGLSIAIGIFILLFALTGGLFLSNLLLGTIFVGFGWVCLAILIPTVLVGGTMVFLEYYLREESGGGGGNTMFQRQASGCGAALAYLLRMIGLCLLAVAVSLFLFYGSFALFLTFPVTFGISTTIFVIMAALMIPSTILALQFLRGYV